MNLKPTTKKIIISILPSVIIFLLIKLLSLFTRCINYSEGIYLNPLSPCPTAELEKVIISYSILTILALVVYIIYSYKQLK